MVSPRSPYKRAWDWLVILVVVATTVVTPLDLSFFDGACNSSSGTADTKPTGEYLLLLDACLLDSQLGNASASAAAYEASRFHLRPACRSSLLGALNYALDAVFWADILATFATGVQKERSTDIKCVFAFFPYSRAHTVTGTDATPAATTPLTWRAHTCAAVLRATSCPGCLGT